MDPESQRFGATRHPDRRVLVLIVRFGRGWLSLRIEQQTKHTVELWVNGTWVGQTMLCQTRHALSVLDSADGFIGLTDGHRCPFCVRWSSGTWVAHWPPTIHPILGSKGLGQVLQVLQVLQVPQVPQAHLVLIRCPCAGSQAVPTWGWPACCPWPPGDVVLCVPREH